MVKLNWIQKLFGGRKSNTPAPTAEQTEVSLMNRVLPRRFRTYGYNTQKQKSLRQLSRNGIVRRGIEKIKKGVLNLDYELKPIGKVPQKKLQYQQAIIKTILDNPNIVHDYGAFFDMILEETIVLDFGVINKVKGGNPMRPLFLYPIDGTTVEILQPYDYTNPDGDMYVQRKSIAEERMYSQREMTHIQMNHFVDTPYGLSAVEKLYRYLNYFMDCLDNSADIASIDSAKFYLHFEGANPDDLRKIREYMSNEIEGTGRVPIFGGSGKASSGQMGAINSDSLFIDYQKFLLTLVAKCFDLPESYFITSDVNDRNTIEEVEQKVMLEAIKPYAQAIERFINVHVLQELGIFDMEFKFVYSETDAQKQARVDRVKSQVALDIITLDEARVELGKQPLNTKYSKVTVSQAKAMINEDFGINGFNGVGSVKDNSSTTSKATKE